MPRSLLITVLGLLIALLFPSSPAAAETLRFSHNAQGASAFFNSFDTSGCILTEVYVAAMDERRKDGSGPGTDQSSAILSISQFDSCTSSLQIAAQGSVTLPPDAFVVDALESASLSTSIEAYDEVSGSTLRVDVSLNWAGSGDSRRVQDRVQIRTQAFTITSRFDGTYRAGAASGSISGGTTNFTPEPPVEASLMSIKAGQLTITRNG